MKKITIVFLLMLLVASIGLATAFVSKVPVYVTERYNEPVYETVYSGSIDVADSALFGLGWKNRRIFLDDLTSYKITEQYSNWGIDLYNVRLVYTSGASRTMSNVRAINLVQSQVVTRYVEKWIQVCKLNCE